MSDWGATHSTVGSVEGGLDMDMSGGNDGYYSSGLKSAVQNGQVSVAQLNAMVLDILTSMFRIGLFDHRAPSVSSERNKVTDTQAEKDLALRLSLAGTVLMKNADGELPLSTSGGHTIAIIGRTAAPGSGGVGLIYNGWGSGHVPRKQVKPGVVSPLEGMQARAAQYGDKITYNDASTISGAASAAKGADTAIVFAYNVAGESTDLPSLNLDSGTGTCGGGCSYQSSKQNELISAVAAANPNTIVVLNTAGPVVTPWANEVKSIIEAWYPGEQYGTAISAILYGVVNPAGKLPETFPVHGSDIPTSGSAAQYPGVNGNVSYSEKLLVGYRWYDARNIAPAFCFGEGLSYTTFGYSALSVTRTTSGANVSFTVTNTGKRMGAEVAQVYVGFPGSTGEPPAQLKGYRKVNLQPGGSTRLTVALGARAFQWWGSNGWTTTPGKYRIMVGSSSCDIRLTGSTSF
jgi:beta-glucosidase